MAPTFCLNTKEVEEKTAKPSHRRGHFVPLVVVLVGLPARGKTVLSHKLERYINWTGHQSKVFSVSTYRRKHVSKFSSEMIFHPDATNKIRIQNLQEAIDDVNIWLQTGGEIAILDGCHETIQIRQYTKEQLVTKMGYKVLFIECIIDDEKILEENIKETIQLSNDYTNIDCKDALKDLTKKVELCTKQYQSISAKEAHLSYIKFFNAGENISVHCLNGPYQTKVLAFVSCFRPMKKTLYFSRHGESEFNLLGRIGGDTDLSPRGNQYANLLANYFNDAKLNDLLVWTSQKKRTKQTAEGIKAHAEHLMPLNELDAGICEGMSYEEMQEKFPQEFAWRDQDKLRYRYPWGESYIDIMARLEPVLLELEREDSVLVVSHQAVLRCVLGYFLNTIPDKLPYMNVPLHTVIKLTTRGYECDVEYIKFNIDCVDTHRTQPKNCSADRTEDDVMLTIPRHFNSLEKWDSLVV